MSVELDNSCFSWNVAFKAADDAKLLNTHIEDYSKMAQIYVERVSRLWNELGFSRGDRQQEFDEVATAIRSVWSATSDRAERKKRERQQEIDDAVAEIYKIKEELGDCTRDSRKQGIEGLLKLEVIVGSSLQTRYEAVQELLREWGAQRRQRETEFKELQSEINNLRLRFGEVVIAPFSSPCKADVSLANLQTLSEELEQCKGEKLKRERELAALLSKLRSACVPLGENDIEIAASAHPSLKFYREALPGHFSVVRPSFSNQPGLQRNIRPEDVELDLSDQTFAALQEKILEVYDLRDVREKQATDVAGALKYLWDLLEVPEDDLERGMLVRCLEGPTRLQMQSIDRCRNEIRQLETTRSDQLWTLIYRARKQLEDICEETMLPMPQLCPLLTGNYNEDDDSKPVGMISDALSKLKKTIVETRQLSEKRTPIILQITQLQSARSEVEWLAEYELDADRYKGRDLSKKLDRALKAGRMRDKFPDMIKRLKKNLFKWEQDEGHSFVYQGQEYDLVLEDMLASLDTKQAANGKHYRQRSGRRPHSRTSGLTPPPLVNSPLPSAEIAFGSGGLHASAHNTKEEEVPAVPDTAQEAESKHVVDGEKEGNCFGKRTISSPLRRSRRRSSKSYDAMDVLQSNGNARSPRYIWGAGGSTPNPFSKPVLDSAEVDSGRGLSKSSSYRNRSTNNSADLKDFNPISGSFLDSDTLIKDRESNPFKGPGSSRRNSFHRERPGGVGSPIPTRETRSAESSGLSGVVENPERRPC